MFDLIRDLKQLNEDFYHRNFVWISLASQPPNDSFVVKSYPACLYDIPDTVFVEKIFYFWAGENVVNWFYTGET